MRSITKHGTAMRPDTPVIRLLVPGLFGPVPTPLAQTPHAPNLARLLGRGDALPQAAADLTDALFTAFGGRFALHQAPSAPFALLGDDPSADQGLYWLHADPVHLRPNRDRLLLFDDRRLVLEVDETDAFRDLFNTHFAEDGLQLRTPTPGRWYLGCRRVPRLTTTGLDAAVGRHIEPLLPAGEDARHWMALLNEIQMLFHQSDVNRRREESGRPTVSGIWPWGGGRRSDFQPRAGYDRFHVLSPLAQGLATAAGVQVQPETQALDGRVLIEMDPLRGAVLDADADSWIHGVEALEPLFARLTAQVRRRTGSCVLVDACDGGHGCLVTRTRWWRFWRRPVDMDRLASGNVAAR